MDIILYVFIRGVLRMNQNLNGMPSEDAIDLYISKLNINYKERCIFRLLSLVDIERREEPFPSESIINIYMIDIDDSRKMGYLYANQENNRIIENIIKQCQCENIINKLVTQCNKILVLLGSSILGRLRQDYLYDDNLINIGNVRFGKIKIKCDGVENIEILTIEHFNGLKIPDNGVIVFKSENDINLGCLKRIYDFNYDNIELTTIDNRQSRMECDIIFPSAEKTLDISTSYGCIDDIDTFTNKLKGFNSMYA